MTKNDIQVTQSQRCEERRKRQGRRYRAGDCCLFCQEGAVGCHLLLFGFFSIQALVVALTPIITCPIVMHARTYYSSAWLFMGLYPFCSFFAPKKYAFLYCALCFINFWLWSQETSNSATFTQQTTQLCYFMPSKKRPNHADIVIASIMNSKYNPSCVPKPMILDTK